MLREGERQRNYGLVILYIVFDVYYYINLWGNRGLLAHSRKA